MKPAVIFAIFVIGFCNSCYGRQVSRDELFGTLRAHGIPEDQLNTWECIVRRESNFETTAVNSNTGDYGLFQISSIYWCSPPGTGCGMTCSSMLDDDINNDVECVKTVFAETQRLSGNGFTAWTTYPDCV